MKYCKYCGAPMDDDAVFCSKCGNKAGNRIQTQTFVCKNCGADMKVYEGDHKVKCPCCGHEQVILEDEDERQIRLESRRREARSKHILKSYLVFVGIVVVAFGALMLMTKLIA